MILRRPRHALFLIGTFVLVLVLPGMLRIKAAEEEAPLKPKSVQFKLSAPKKIYPDEGFNIKITATNSGKETAYIALPVPFCEYGLRAVEYIWKAQSAGRDLVPEPSVNLAELYKPEQFPLKGNSVLELKPGETKQIDLAYDPGFSFDVRKPGKYVFMVTYRVGYTKHREVAKDAPGRTSLARIKLMGKVSIDSNAVEIVVNPYPPVLAKAFENLVQAEVRLQLVSDADDRMQADPVATLKEKELSKARRERARELFKTALKEFQVAKKEFDAVRKKSSPH